MRARPQMDNSALESVVAKKYSRAASQSVKRAMHKRKAGTLKSGPADVTVKSRKQAVAIGLSEARRAGNKAPPAPSHAH